MPGVAKPLEELQNDIKWLIEHGRGQEKGIIYMPKVEAQRRRENKEGHRRVVFVTDPDTYKLWHAERDRWIELCDDNPTIAYPLMCSVLQRISDEAIRGLVEAGKEG